jgi:quinol monooxygenase YgiN
MIAVIARIPVKPEKKEQALETIRNLMTKVAEEEGTLSYSVNINEQDPDTLVFIEHYRDMDALSVHGQTPHFKDFMKQAAEFASGKPEITVYKQVASI